ncbi:MAG: response regulator [Gammaproteobacteria bacterium]|nr:response regulator [Gammaproteobacteria bacterium]
MSRTVLICDDSTFAQKQMARALPEDLPVSISFANNGQEAIRAIKEGKGDVVFLDLNMPVMDGYQALEQIRGSDLVADIIVVSGDIQAEAHRRVMDLGALAFIKKPVNKDDVAAIIREFDLFNPDKAKAAKQGLDTWDAYREVANVAMGQASALLAKVLNTFVIMPIPNVNMLEVSELQMAIAQVGSDDQLDAVCQGFIGGGIAGEAMLVFSESSYADIAKLTNFEGVLDDAAEMELLMDLTNILIGACVKSIAEQFDINLSLSHPIVLGRHGRAQDLLKSSKSWTKTLAIDMNIGIENYHINGSLLLLFTEDSIPRLDYLIGYAAA